MDQHAADVLTDASVHDDEVATRRAVTSMIKPGHAMNDVSATPTASDWRDRAAALQIQARAFIDGHYVDAASGATFEDVSPIDGRVIARVASTERGSGAGTTLIEWAVEQSRRLGVALVQLTSDATRTDAHRFYERLGFVKSHVGFKLEL